MLTRFVVEVSNALVRDGVRDRVWPYQAVPAGLWHTWMSPDHVQKQVTFSHGVWCVYFQKDLIVLNEITGVMGVDALASSHPLSSKEEDINTPADISQLFDSITYSKVQLPQWIIDLFILKPS